MTQALLLLLAAVNPFAAAAGLVTALPDRPATADEDGLAALRRNRLLTLFVAGDVVIAAAVLLGWLSDPILDLLDVSLPTFQVGAAIVVGLSGFLWLIRGASVPVPVPADGGVDGDAPADEQLPAGGRWRGLIVPLLIPVLVTPALVTASITAGADHGVTSTTLAVVLTLLVTGLGALAPRSVTRTKVVWAVGARFVGALAIVLALALAVDGVKSV